MLLALAAFACSSSPPPAAATGPADAAVDAPVADFAGIDTPADVPLPDVISPGCAILNCDDNNSCTFDDCLDGSCTHAPVAGDTACDDLDGCTVGDSCDASGTCVPGPICPGGGVCTGGVCTACGPTTNPLPDPAGAPCVTGGDCDSGYCIDTADGKFCAIACVSSDCCPDGWGCKNVALTGDPVYGCVPNLVHACDPCTDDAQCHSPGDSAGLCLSYGDVGSFCGGTCTTDTDCPASYYCLKNAKGTANGVAGAGGTGNQCVKKNGTCECSKLAKALGLSTICASENKYGACTGGRQCQPSGLTGCNAKAPAAEVCNGLDDNCDGVTDEDGSSGCTNWYADDDGDGFGGQSLGCTCSAPTGSVVAKGGDCNDAVANIHPGATPFCSGIDANCDGIADSTSCDDGNPCTLDGCSVLNGSCGHFAMPSCLQGCKSASDPSCNDGNPCTDDSCVAGACAHAVGLGCACTASCDDGDVCTVDLCLDDHTCAHVVDLDCTCGSGSECDDANLCTIDFCKMNPGDSEGECVNQPVAGCCNAGFDCNDAKSCTTDSCDVSNHTCSHIQSDPACCDADTQCSDGSPCTEDLCINHSCVFAQDSLGPVNPLPAACTPALCDDGNPCTTDACGCTGYCENTAIAGCTLPCDVTNCSAAGNCVTKSCDATGQCVKTNACNPTKCLSSFDCDDGDGCTADLCVGGSCIYKVLTCDDANPCTLDACLAGGCTHVFVLGCVAAK